MTPTASQLRILACACDFPVLVVMMENAKEKEKHLKRKKRV